jgi:hypothetical protein
VRYDGLADPGVAIAEKAGQDRRCGGGWRMRADGQVYRPNAVDEEEEIEMRCTTGRAVGGSVTGSRGSRTTPMNALERERERTISRGCRGAVGTAAATVFAEIADAVAAAAAAVAGQEPHHSSGRKCAVA